MARCTIVGTTVLDTTSANPQPARRALVIEDGRVVAWQDPDEPAEGDVWDASGLFAIPGLIDLHLRPFRVGAKAGALPHADSVARNVQRAQCALQAWLDVGVTSARTVGAHDNLDLELRDWVNSGKMPGPRLFSCGTAIGATSGGRWSEARVLREVTGPDEARRAARQQIKAGVDAVMIQADWPGVGSRWADYSAAAALDGDEIRAIVEEARHAGVFCCASALGKRGVESCARAGVHSVHLADAPDEELMDVLAQCGTTWVPALAGTWSVAGSGTECGHALAPVEAAAQRLAAGAAAVGRARRAGVTVATGSDADDLSSGVPEECYRLAQAGLSPYQVLQAATVRAAEVLDRYGDIGSLLPGHRADVVLLEADPLLDIRNLGSVYAVFQGGMLRLVKDETLHSA